MGNTSSSQGKKSGTTERLRTTHSSIQEEHDPVDDEAAEAASQPAADEHKTTISNMPAEIVSKVVDFVKDPKLNPDINLEKAKSILAATSRLFHATAAQHARITAKAILAAAHGNQDALEKLFAISPAHICYAVTKSDVEDYSHRKFTGENKISPWMYAIWADDYHMYTMMWDAVKKVASTAIPNTKFSGKTADKIAELRRHKPYIGRLTEAEVVELKQELFRQYKEVTEHGINYTIDYDELTTTVPNTVQPVIVQYARTVEVKGETHFDLKGPEFCVMKKDEQLPLEKGKIYVQIEGNILHYRVLSLASIDITDSIPLADLNCPLKQLTDIEVLKPFITPLLKITSERAHTHPQALLSAFNTFAQQYNNWDWPTRKKHWCQVVGLAERLLTPPAAQQICEAVALNQEKNFHLPLKRSFKFYNFIPPEGYQFWFPLNRLGIDYAIANFTEGARAGAELVFNGVRLPIGPYAASRNSAALSVLCEKRTKDVKMLGEQLSEAVKNQDNLEQGSMPSMTS